MGDIYVYSASDDSNDYSTFGLVGALIPDKCIFKEEANGESSLAMSHPIDAFGRYTALQRGNILSVPVPVRTVSEVEDGNVVTTVWHYTVKAGSAGVRTLYKKSTGNKKIATLKVGTKVTVVWQPNDDDTRWKVKCSKGTGYMYKDGLSDEPVATYTLPSDNPAQKAATIQEIEGSWHIREQYFRIFETKIKMDSIEVSARHISYDLLYSTTDYSDKNEKKLDVVLNGIMSKLYADTDFRVQTNVENKRAGNVYRDKNPIEAFLDPEEGVCKKFDVALIRDNYDLYFIHDPGINRGIRVQYSKNMVGVEFTSSEDEVATRIVPVGEQKNGKPLYLHTTLYNNPPAVNDGQTSRCIDSSIIDAYPVPHVYVLKCEGCKIGDQDASGTTITENIAKNMMRSQANALLASECDRPKIEMKVEFVNLGDTEEYKQFKGLEDCFIFDYVIVQHPSLYYKNSSGVVEPVNITARVVSIEWDCILDRMNSVEIGHNDRHPL